MEGNEWLKQPPPPICPNSTRISGVIVTIPEVLDWDSSLRTHTISNLDSSLKKTTDPDLKRLFVLQHLYGEMDIAVSDYKEGVVVAGKGMKRNMTPEEKEATRKKLIEKIKDLELFDPKDPEREIAQHREALK